MLSFEESLAKIPGLRELTRTDDKPWSKGGNPRRLAFCPYDKKVSTLPVSSEEAHNQAGHDCAIDFPMPIGTKLFATCPGKVITVIDHHDDIHYALPSTEEEKLNYIIVEDQTSKQKHFFGHVRKGSARVKVGDYVKTGALIAESGHNGASTSPHLHFGVYKDDDSAPNIWNLQSIPITIAWREQW